MSEANKEVNKCAHPRVGIGVLIFKEDKVLLGLRKGAHGSGEYAGPGGHLEYMESLQDCAIREVREETGIKIKNLGFQLVHNVKTYAPRHYIHIAFLADWASGEPQVLEPEKCLSWGWYDLDNLPEPIFSTVKVSIEMLNSDIKFLDS